MRRIEGWQLALFLFLCLLGPPLEGKASGEVLRIGTLLPTGSSWMKILGRFAKRVSERSKGQLRVILYGGAIMGDERDMVQKMRAGRIEGAALTGNGMGLILPEVRVLELPYLFESYLEVDAVRGALTPELAAGFQKRGFVLLGWGDVGWVHIFSKQPLRTIEDLKKVRIWSWTDDPLARAAVSRFPVKAVPLGIQDVLPALQTGLIDTCYGSAYTTVSFQWHTEVRTVSERGLTYATGALLLTKRALDPLAPRLRAILIEEGTETMQAFVRVSREDNDKAFELLSRLGIEVNHPSRELHALVKDAAQKTWGDLTGKLFPKDLLDRVLRLRGAIRVQ
jgi:TRAP-type transport system periplasmic protein